MNNTQKLTIVLVGLIVLLVIINAFFLWGLQKTAPPNPSDSGSVRLTELVSIVSNNCPDCIELSGLTDQIKQLDINFSERSLTFETDSEAQELVQQYSIQKLPALLIKATPRDFNRLEPYWESLGTTEEGNILVLRQLPPPYYNIASQSTKGLVKMWSISKSNCSDCTPAPQQSALEQLGISFSQVHVLLDADSEAQALISQYSITKLPTLVLSNDIQEYAHLFSVLNAGGEFASDGAWVLRNPVPFYWDLNSNKKVGAVSLVRLTDSDCNECFSIGKLEDFLKQNLSLKIVSDQNLDWSTPAGKQFVHDYNITRLPTLVLGGELEAYNGLQQTWSSFGFTAPDGNLVFASHSQLGSGYRYFDIDQNKVMDSEGA
jgi:glutaredoxin